MATPANYFKLGLFVIVVVVAALVIAIVLGFCGMQKNRLDFHTYFDESVQGLEIDSPVKLKGVTVGSVAQIAIAPDHRHVAVTLGIDVDALGHLGFRGEDGGVEVPSDLRAQLASAAITGGKLIALDYVAPKTHPPPALPFSTPERYIPATPSMIESLEKGLAAVLDDLPRLTEAVARTATRIDDMLAQLDEGGVTAHAVTTLTRAERVLGGLERTIRQIDRAGLTGKTSATLDALAESLAKMNGALNRVDGDHGLIASARRASDTLGDLGQGLGPTGRELELTLREIQAAAESIRALAEAIDREPDMLLKGRPKQTSPHGGAP